MTTTAKIRPYTVTCFDIHTQFMNYKALLVILVLVLVLVLILVLVYYYRYFDLTLRLL